MREHKYTTEKEIELLQEEIKSAQLNARKLSRKAKRAIHVSTKVFGLIVFLTMFVFLICILYSVIVSKYSGETPQVFGYQMYQIKSGSMSPTLNVGTVILSKIPKEASALKAGDIVTFEHNEKIITHRIIEVVKKDGIRYRTKGDNPVNSPDVDLLSPDAVKAVFILKIPFI